MKCDGPFLHAVAAEQLQRMPKTQKGYRAETL